MDARRFDGLARLMARGRSRRGVLRSLAGVMAGALMVQPRLARADGEPAGVGGADGGAVCLPVSRPASAASTARPPFQALITAGTCENPDFSTTYSLLDVATTRQMAGAPTAAAVAQSVTTVRVQLDDLVDRVHAIMIRSSDDAEAVVACGEIGGLRAENDLTVGLRERNASDFSGIAWLRGSNSSTLVYLFLGRGLSTVETIAATKGTKVVTTDDVNLRAEPSADAAVIAVLPGGTTVTVTGAAQDDWLPVENPATGDAGWVAAQFLVIQE
jgi:hypothetical protein